MWLIMLPGTVGVSVKSSTCWLLGVDLDKRDADVVAVRLLELEVLVVAQQVMPEAQRRRQVGDEVADVRDAGDPRTLWGLLRPGSQGQHEGEQAKQEAEPEPGSLEPGSPVCRDESLEGH